MKSRLKFFLLFSAAVSLNCSFIYSAKKPVDTKNNSSSTAKSLNDVLANYPERFRDINASAISYADSGNFSQAINAFFEATEENPDAFNFNRDRHSSSARMNLNTIDEIINEVKSELEKIKVIQTEMNSLKLNYAQVMNLNSYENIFSEYAATYNKILENGIRLKKAGSDPYILSLQRFILGVSENKKTGIIGILGFQWDSVILKLQETLKNEIENESKSLNNFFETSNLFTQTVSTAGAKNSFRKIKDTAAAIKDVNGFNEKINLENGRNKLSLSTDIDSSCVGLMALCDEGDSLVRLIEQIETAQKTNFAKPQDKVSAIRSGTDNYTQSLFDNGRKFGEFKNDATTMKRSVNLRTIQNIKNAGYKWETLTKGWNLICSSIENFCEDKSKQFWIEGAQYYADCGKDILASDSSEYESISNLISDENKSYAQKCLNQIQEFKDSVEKDINILEFGREQLETVTNKNAWFKSSLDALRNCSNKLMLLSEKCDETTDSAKRKLILSQSAKNEIDIYYNQSNSFFKKNNFQNAFDNLNKTKNLYQQKIDALKNDIEIQEALYEKIEALRRNIISKQEPIYLAELNKLKNSARVSYYAGNFNEASATISLVDSKREQWAKLIDAEINEDPSLEQLRDFINTAQAIKEGRELSPYDAKAPEMKQNLSVANHFYEEGKKLSGEGKTAEANECFNKASEKVNQIKIYYPRNKDASILALRIDQIVNKDTFDQTFSIKVKTLGNTNFADKSAVSQQNYNDLLDLYELNPNYPGLKNIIYNAEISLGLRQRPVSNDNLKKASEIAANAQRILNSAGRDELKLNEARNLAQKAIELNPSNNVALSVLDEISLRTGSKSAVVLSAADEELYNKAVADLQAGKIFDAREKLNRLLSNPANANSAKIQKLKRRVEA